MMNRWIKIYFHMWLHNKWNNNNKSLFVSDLPRSPRSILDNTVRTRTMINPLSGNMSSVFSVITGVDHSAVTGVIGQCEEGVITCHDIPASLSPLALLSN